MADEASLFAGAPEIPEISDTPASQPIAEQPAGSPAVATPAETTAPVGQTVPTATEQATTTTSASPAATDPRAAINAFAEQMGVDASRFANVNDLAAAHQQFRQWQEQEVAEGAQYLQQLQYEQDYPETPAGQPPQQYQQPQRDPYGRFVPQQQLPYDPRQMPQMPVQYPAGTTPQPAVDLKSLGLEPDDPVAKVILAQDARYNQLQNSVEKLVTHFDRQQEAAKAQAKAERTARAEQTIDSWNSPLYGKSGRRTITEQARVDQVYALANYVIAKARQQGQPAPTIEQCVNRARFQLEMEAELAAPKQTGQHALPSVQASPPPEVKGLSLMEKWSDNPAFMASLPR